jgi:hypothetical protein
MGLFGKKQDPAEGGLSIPNNSTTAKSETTTAVPSRQASETGSLEKSRELNSTVLDEKATDGAKPTIDTSTDDVTEAKAEGEVHVQRRPSNALSRTQSNSIISTPGAEDDDEIVYPGGLKLATIIVALCLGVFLVALDNTIIATAIPKITDHFKSLGDVGWYGSSYLLTTCALQLFFGKLYTFYSIKTVFLVSIAIFEVGSALCGAAPSSVALIVGRAIAGIGSAGIFAGALIIIAYSVPLVKRPIYTGLVGGKLP